MKKNIRRLLIAVLALVFAASVGALLYETVQYREGEETYNEAAELAGIEAAIPEPSGSAASSGADSSGAASSAPVYIDPYADELANMDFGALQEVNSDILGWILIPNTVVSYPVMQTDDNSYYLKHTWRKTGSVVGGIFLEEQSSADLSDFNTVIYGHNMNNGSMFGSLKKYKSKSYWAAHPNVYLTTGNGSRTYRIFAAYEVSTQGTTYQIGFPSDASKQSFLDFCAGQSVISTDVTPTIYDQIITLSTCTGRGHATRWVVQAVWENPDAPAETALAPVPQETPAATPETVPEPQESAPDGSAIQPVEDAADDAAQSADGAGSAEQGDAASADRSNAAPTE
jgi:sortase B